MSRRSRPTMLSAASLTLLLLGSAPLSAMTEMLGGGFMVGGGTCADFGWVGTQQVLARMEPQGAPGNPADETQMALLLSTGTIAIRFDNERAYRHTQAVDQATYVWNGPWSPEEPTMSFSWNLYGDIPGTRDSELSELILDFDNFNEHPGCRMSVFLVLRRN